MTAVLWTRNESRSADRSASLFLLCFSTGALRADIPLSMGRFGIPSPQRYRDLEVRRWWRGDSPDWFDGWRTGAIRNVAEGDLQAGLAALEEADLVSGIRHEGPDPPDLGHLQAAWAVARWMVACGATAVLDVYAARFLEAARVAAVPADAPFDVRREVRIVFETDATAPGGDHVLHTRGMRKFGRPDLVAIVRRERAAAVADVLWQVAEGMAMGFLPARPRHGVDLAPDLSLFLVPPPPDDTLTAKLVLQNDALFLAGPSGEPLTRL